MEQENIHKKWGMKKDTKVFNGDPATPYVRDYVTHPLSKEEEIEIAEIKRGRGIVKCISLEQWLWTLRGSNKLERIIDVASIYNDKVNKATLAKYFYPTPPADANIYDFESINHFILWFDGDLYWTDKYKDIMFSISW